MTYTRGAIVTVFFLVLFLCICQPSVVCRTPNLICLEMCEHCGDGNLIRGFLSLTFYQASSNMAPDILALGAGELDKAVLAGLAKKAPATTNIIVLLRPSIISSPSASKQAEITALKALNDPILPGDVSTSSVPALASLFEPYDLVISCLGFASGPGSHFKLAQTVLQAGAKRYVPWQFIIDCDIIGRGSAQDLFDE